MTKTAEEKRKEGIEQYVEWQQAREGSMRHWRAWGSWFSWGSPVGLGLFFISIAISVWIIVQAF